MPKLQHPVPPKALQGIGDIVVSFALLESNLQSLAWWLLQQDQRVGQIVTAELSFSSLRALVKSLYLARYGKDAEFESLGAIIRQCAEIEKRRNQIVHSLWAAGDGPDAITRIKDAAKEKRGYQSTFEAVTTHTLAAFATQIAEHAYAICRFTVEIRESGKKIYGPWDPPPK